MFNIEKDIQITVPYSPLVAVFGVKYQIRCIKCGWTWAAWLNKMFTPITYELPLGWDVCVRCAAEGRGAK